MYISEIAIDGYKNCRDKSIISFHPGLNILVGENASGKTTIIDAIRMVLRDQEMGHISEDDFYKAFDLTDEKKNICIDLKMSNLTPQEKVTFLTWCNADFDAELHLEVEKNPNTKGYCFLQALFPQKCRLTSSKLHGEFPHYCISSSGTLSGAGEESLQAYKVY